MNIRLHKVVVVTWAIVLFGQPPAALGSREATTDNRIAALDARTGQVIWIYTLEELNYAHFELHEETLVVFPNYEGNDRSDAFYLETLNGEPTSAPPQGSTPLTKSDTFQPLPEIRLSNGWELFGFNSGYDRSLNFMDPTGNGIAWSIQTSGYPTQIAAYEDTVFWAFSFYVDEAVLYAYRAGESQSLWTFDVNSQVSAQPPLNRPFPHVMEDDLFLGANEHIFELDPRTGQVRHHWDLVNLLGLPFEPNFYDGGLNLAVFARDDRTMVVSYEARLVAIDRESRDVLWSVHPSTGSTPFPIVHENQVYTSWGSAAVAVAAVAETDTPSEGSTQPESQPDVVESPPPVERSGHCGCMVEPTRGGLVELSALILLLLLIRRIARR